MGNKSSTDKASKAPDSGTKKDLTLDDFNLGKVLGEGTFAEVRLATSKDGKNEAAVKILFDNDVEAIQREIDCMKLCSHENSIKLLGAAAQATHNKKEISYLILELAVHGELFQILAMTGAFDADIARLFAKQLYTVVNYFHEQGVTHRDLKPENILLDSSCCIKVADFGLATKLPDDDGRLTELVGSPGYIAPEVYAGSYHHENDIWAACVIHFIMMTGCPPFRQAKSDDWWFSKLKAQKWKRWWSAHEKNSGVEMKDDAKDLFQQVFEIDPNKRPAVSTILKHKWFQADTCPQEDLMDRFHGKMASDYNDYAEEDVSENLGDSDMTHRGEGKKEDVDSDQPPFVQMFCLPKRKKGEQKDDDVTSTGDSSEPINRGENDEGDEKAEDADVYQEKVTCYTKFRSESSPSVLYARLIAIMTEHAFSYTKDGTYGIIVNLKEKKTKFKAQVFKESEKSSNSLLAVNRLLGETRDYMSIFAKIRVGMDDLILRPTPAS